MPTASWARDAGGQKHILHVHGPKLDKVKCVLDYIDDHKEYATVPWDDDYKKLALQHCSMAHHQSDAMMSILEAAYVADQGKMYRTTQILYNRYLSQANAIIRKGTSAT